jgi:hypothetical protein
VLLTYPSGNTTVPTVTGKIGTTLFLLGEDAKASVGGDGTGTFSGTDTIGGGAVQGSFICG